MFFTFLFLLSLTAETTFGWLSPELAWLCCLISLSLRYPSSIYHSLPFYMLYLGSVLEKVIINLFNFHRNFKSTPFHTVTDVHLISHQFVFKIFISLYLWSMLTCLFAMCLITLLPSDERVNHMKHYYQDDVMRHTVFTASQIAHKRRQL
jgi:hypothetical protein